MANLDPITGGGGGTSFRDGTEGSGANFGFLKNTPVEINEAEVAKHPYEQELPQRVYYKDGAVGDW